MKYKVILLLAVAGLLAASVGLASCQSPQTEQAQEETEQATNPETALEEILSLIHI